MNERGLLFFPILGIISCINEFLLVSRHSPYYLSNLSHGPTLPSPLDQEDYLRHPA